MKMVVRVLSLLPMMMVMSVPLWQPLMMVKRVLLLNQGDGKACAAVDGDSTRVLPLMLVIRVLMMVLSLLPAMMLTEHACCR